MKQQSFLQEVFGNEAEGESSNQIRAFYKVLEDVQEDVTEHGIEEANKELLQWFNTVSDKLMEQAQERTSIQRENLLMYRGSSMKKRDIDRERFFNGRRINQLQKFIIPHIHDLTETRISQMTRIRPSVEVLPSNNEWEDRASAKVVQNIIKHLWYINNIDYKIQELHRHARIFGESFLFVDWDPNAGDLLPLYVQAKEMGLDAIQGPDGKVLTLDKPMKTGDVKYSVELPWRVFLQRKTSFDDVEYCFRAHLISTASLRDRFNNNSIKPTQDLKMFDMDDMDDKPIEDHTLVLEFWHKGTAELPEGFHALFTKDEILLAENNPYTGKMLPMVRLTDLDVPQQLNGVSKYELIAPIANMYNNVNTLIAKNIWLTAHAKWMMPRGAAKIEQLGNDNTVVQYQGPVPPKLAQVMPNPPEVYRYSEDLLRQMQIIYGSHGISRGEIPTGITASSALQFLNQLESERASTEISKHGFTIIELAKLTISIVGDKYEEDDGRLLRIVGENNQFLIRQFDTAHLHKDYDIRFDLSTGLPDTKAGKRQLILDMMQRNPTGNTMERWEELLEVANLEKALDMSTSAYKAADSENEDMAAGRPVGMPEQWEDHIAHLDSHYRFMQTRTYKEEMNPEYRKTFNEHVYWTEEAALDKARTNPQFQAKLASLTLFPVFFHEGFQAPMGAEHAAALVQGAANATGMAPEGVQIPTAELPTRKR